MTAQLLVQQRQRGSSFSSGTSSHMSGRSRSSSIGGISNGNAVAGGGHHHNQHHHHGHHNQHHRKPQNKSDLWKGCINTDIGNSIIVQIVGMKSSSHTVYARVNPNCSASADSIAQVTIGKVIETMVNEGWKYVAKEILEKHVHVETKDAYPSAAELLSLGSVWILNESEYAKGNNYHAHRLKSSDEGKTDIDWTNMSLRVHYVPDRFFVANEYDWSKYCKGLLLDNCTSAIIGGKKAVVPMMGLPDGKDGVLVYQDNDIGFAVLNKPGGMPCFSTISNCTEDVQHMFGSSLKQRGPTANDHPFVSIPLVLEPEMNGLLLAATKKEFCGYLTKQLKTSCTSNATTTGVTKTYRCLVCIRNPDNIDRIEALVDNQTIIEHYVDVRSPTPKKFVRQVPSNSNHKWEKCQMKITAVSSQSMNFRAACVKSKYADSNDFTLAHRLWGPDKACPAEELGIQYVMQVDVQLLTKAPHQIRGQLATLGIPIVGDAMYGGGVCEMRGHRHMWTRMAVQICHLEFTLPKWAEVETEDKSSKKRVLVSSDEGERCVFHLNTCWWSEYLVDYEAYSLAQDMANTNVAE